MEGHRPGKLRHIPPWGPMSTQVVGEMETTGGLSILVKSTQSVLVKGPT